MSLILDPSFWLIALILSCSAGAMLIPDPKILLRFKLKALLCALSGAGLGFMLCQSLGTEINALWGGLLGFIAGLTLNTRAASLLRRADRLVIFLLVLIPAGSLMINLLPQDLMLKLENISQADSLIAQGQSLLSELSAKAAGAASSLFSEIRGGLEAGKTPMEIAKEVFNDGPLLAGAALLLTKLRHRRLSLKKILSLKPGTLAHSYLVGSAVLGAAPHLSSSSLSELAPFLILGGSGGLGLFSRSARSARRRSTGRRSTRNAGKTSSARRLVKR